MQKIITPQAAKKKIDSQEELTILDVREPEEYAAGHIPQAVLLPLGQVEEQAESLFPQKDSPLLVYCRSGRRSALAVQKLSELGYTQVYDLGGILDWPYETE